MKEIIGTVFLLIGILAGAHGIHRLHDQVRQMALEKAAMGLPSLTQMTNNLQGKGSSKRGNLKK